MDSYIHEFATFLRHHINAISVGMVATLLMLVGSKINGFFKKITRSIPFVGRFALFVLLCSAGYAFLSSQFCHLLRWFLVSLADVPLIACIAGCYIGLAVMAYRAKEV